MKQSIDFIHEENLYTSAQYIYNGTSYIRYADFIIYENGEFYHIVLIKEDKLFMFKEYNTMKDIPFLLAKKILKLAQIIDYSSYSVFEKPDISCFERLYTLIDADKCHYQDKNVVIDLVDTQPNKKTILFTINNNIPIITMDVVISNLQTVISANISRTSYEQIRNLDKIFSIKANAIDIFKNLLCKDSNTLTEGIFNLVFYTEQEHYLKSTIMQKSLLSGNVPWAFDITKHLTNLGRDNPIEMKLDGVSSRSHRLFFVFAIRGLSIPYDLRFGLVTFSNDSGIDKERASKFLELTAQKPDCYAHVTIFEGNINDAIGNAKKSIKKAIELLQVVILDDSTTFFFETQNNVFENWSRSRLDTRLSIANYFYIEDVENNMNYAILPSKQLELDTTNQISNKLFELLNDDNIIENFFYFENKKNEDLLQSIFLLNQSYKTKDKSQRIIALYNSIEFLVAGEAGCKLKEELSIYDEYKQIMGSIEQVIEKINNSELKKRMEGALQNTFAGNSSVKSKLESLISKLELKLSEYDWQLFEKLKNNRQKLIHNKKLKGEISHQELNELYHLISKIIISYIVHLTNKEGV